MRLLFAAFIVTIFSSCGEVNKIDDPNQPLQEKIVVTMDKSAPASGVLLLTNNNELPVCDQKNQDQISYIKEEKV